MSQYKRPIATGTFTANGASTVTVTTPAIDPLNTMVQISMRTVGGTPAAHPYVFTVTAGTSFGVRAAAGDTSVYNWEIVSIN